MTKGYEPHIILNDKICGIFDCDLDGNESKELCNYLTNKLVNFAENLY